MSASLVGSEMCIRDRCSPPRVASSRPQPGTGCGSGASPWRRSRAPPRRDCLLYTSDAADDM
eukprot:14710032-Alexandrium_andersonii.AAC.1